MRAVAFLLAAATAGIAAILPSGGARAALVLTASLSGANEVPPNNSPGTGTASVTLENDNRTLDVSLAFSDLTSGSLFADIHCCTDLGGNRRSSSRSPLFQSSFRWSPISQKT